MQRANSQRSLINADIDPIGSFRNSLRSGPPWESIVDFATHKSFCGKRLYPRQLTFLKIAYLEDHNFTDYDYEVIDEWTTGFHYRDPEGIQPDILDRIAYLKERGYRWFPHIQMVMGRRASKGICGGIIGAHQIAYMHSLDDWQGHFGLDPGAVAYAAVVAVNQTQATRTLFNDMRTTVEGCQYLTQAISTPRADNLTLRTAGDVRRIADMERRGIPIEREIASIQAVAASSNSASIRGNSMFFLAFYEMAHRLSGTGGTRTAEELYHAMQPSLDQFGNFSMIYVPSSPYTMTGVFYDLYREGRAPINQGRTGPSWMDEADEGDEGVVQQALADPRKLLLQLPSWALYKDWEKAHTLKMTPGKHSRRFERLPRAVTTSPEEDERVAQFEASNPEKFRVERRGQFAAVMDAYLRPEKVEQMFEAPSWREPLSEQAYGQFQYYYRTHCDPGRTNANFAMATGHLEDSPPDEYGDVWPHVIFDKLQVWKPKDFKDHVIDYLKVTEDLDEHLTLFPSIKRMSFDQWNSAGFIAALNSKHGPRIRITEEAFSEKVNQARCEKFKSALYLGWIHSYRDPFFNDGDSLLEQELKFLQEVNGKVVKQDVGPVRTKDLADCVMSVSVSLLSDSLDRWEKKLIGNASFGISDVGALKSGRATERHLSNLTPRRSSTELSPIRARLEQHSAAMRSSRRSNVVSSPTRGRGYR